MEESSTKFLNKIWETHFKKIWGKWEIGGDRQMKKAAVVLFSVLTLSMILPIVTPAMAKTGNIIVVVRDGNGSPVEQNFWVA